jgi:hypothetical protein
MIRMILLATGLTLATLGAASAQTDKPKAVAGAKDAGKAQSAKAQAAGKAQAEAKAEGGKAHAGKAAAEKGPAGKAQADKAQSEKTADQGKAGKGKGAKGKAAAASAAGGGKPTLVSAHGDWGAYLANGAKGKVCYALAQPKQRQPSGLKRSDAYIFISTRPAENVRGEISIMMGFPLKEGASGAVAEIGSQSFELVAKGENAWVKNAAEESQLSDAMRKGSRLVIKAPSAKGAMSMDTYSLVGLAQALDQVRKDCN